MTKADSLTLLSSGAKQRLLWLWYPLPFIVFLAIWHFYTLNAPERQFIFATPGQVFMRLYALVYSGELLSNASITLFEALCGFLLGTTTGALIGLSFWYSRTVASVAQPYIAALASVPIFALAPMIIVWFGIGIASKIALAFLSTVVVAIVQSYEGARNAEPRFLKLMQVVKATSPQTFRIVIVPSALVWVINAMKLNIGLSLLGAFIGEFISAERGLGYMIVKASGLYDMPTVLAGVFTLIFISLVLTALVEKIEHRLMRWSRA
jgi:NitT/TauT family transport system permease protein